MSSTAPSTTSPAGTAVGSAARPQAGSSIARVAARVLLALYGLVGVAATVFFTFFASVEEGRVSGALDWVVAAWSMTIAIGFLVSAFRLGDRTRSSLRLAAGFVIAHVAFGVVKFFGYGETEAVGFFAVDLVLLGLLALAGRARRV